MNNDSRTHCAFENFGSWRISPAFAVVLLAIFLVGCQPGNPMGSVKGNVSVNGSPFSDASIMFLSPSTGQAEGGDIAADGTFSFANKLPVGEYTVYFAPKSLPEEENGAPVPVSMNKSLPEEYWAEFSSKLRANVVEGDNDIPIEVKF